MTRFVRCAWWSGLVVLAAAWSHAETLTIATYNLENYTVADRMTEDGFRKNYPKPEEEKQALRAVLIGLNADILAVQEMGGPAYLEELRRDLKAGGLDYPQAVLLEGPDPDRHIALLARIAPVAVRQHREIAFNYQGRQEKVKRGLLEATFRTATGDLTLFVVHLKSRFTDRADDPQSAGRRAGEATAVRDLVLQRISDPARAQFIVLGDCNDEKRSRTVQHLLKRGSIKLVSVLAAADSRGETWTHAYRVQDSYSRVDYVMVSARLESAVTGGVARIYDAPETRRASDHRPVVVTLQLEKR